MTEILLEGCCETIPELRQFCNLFLQFQLSQEILKKKVLFQLNPQANIATEDHEFVELQFEGSQGKKDDTRKLVRIQDLHS